MYNSCKQFIQICVVMNQETLVFVNKYIESMSPKEKKAMEIAKSHLGSTFSIEKSVGFLKWLKKNQAQAQT